MSLGAPGKLYLASQSPRRRELLSAIGIAFEVMAADIDESPKADEAADDYVLRLAAAKARAIGNRVGDNCLVVGADTTVVVDDTILSKPTDANDAQRMLQLLSGRGHQVMTAVAVRQGDKAACEISVSNVYFRPIDSKEIARYWLSGEPIDKAGGYAIQGLGASFVRHLEGSYSGVVGLPLYELSGLLRRFGLNLF